MEKIKSWNIISNLGEKVKTNWNLLAKNHKIKLTIQGLSALPRFDFDNKNNLYYKTFVSQEFLKRKILASNSIYLCTEHNIKDLDDYFNILDSIFFKINKSIKDEINPKELLDGPVCISGIRSNY
jgi:glutamate-1-semialdehyde 2,1-aminomutase